MPVDLTTCTCISVRCYPNNDRHRAFPWHCWDYCTVEKGGGGWGTEVLGGLLIGEVVNTHLLLIIVRIGLMVAHVLAFEAFVLIILKVV